MSGPLHGYRSTGGHRLAIALSALGVAENAAQGTEVGVLSGLPGDWTITLADNAGGMFALDGRRVVVGPTPLNYAAAPLPKLLVAASDGKRAAAELLTIEVRRPLPALPFAPGARLGAIGDSQIAYNNTFGSAVGVQPPSTNTLKAALSTGYGFLAHAKAHDQRFRFESWYDTADPRGLNYVGANQGIHGDHMDWSSNPAVFGGGILGRLPALLARRPDILLVEGGVNTISSGDDGRAGSSAYVIVKLERTLRLARAAGIWTVPMTIYPRLDWETSGNNPRGVQAIREVNAWIRAQAGREGVAAILDAEPMLRPGGAGTALDATLYKDDGVHLSPKGALAFARQRFLPLVATLVQPGTTFDKDPSVANLCAPAIYNMAGTGGTKPGATGDVATGYVLQKLRNATAVGSKEVVAGALEQQVIAITPGGGTTDATAYGEVSLSGILAMESANPNQWYQAFLEVETSGDGLTFAELRGGHRLNTANVTQTISLGRESSAAFALGDGGGARSFWLQTEPFRSTESYDRIAMLLYLTFSKTAAPFTVKARKPIVRRVPDPRPAWGY